MSTKVDMTYSFLQDDEPTDEQLLVIMQEVGEDVRRQRKDIAKQVLENLERERTRCRNYSFVRPMEN